jgi:hypothetical protein
LAIEQSSGSKHLTMTRRIGSGTDEQARNAIVVRIFLHSGDSIERTGASSAAVGIVPGTGTGTGVTTSPALLCKAKDNVVAVFDYGKVLGYDVSEQAKV